MVDAGRMMLLDPPTPADMPPATAELPAAPADSRLRRLLRGRADDAIWVRPCVLVLLVGTAVLYIWGLGAAGWANDYYSAAVQAGTKSWKAFFFGSSDAANFITVDKPPASLWVMELSARVFGLNSWSILVPQALEGVAAVGLLYLTVRRWFGATAGLVAGAVMALTPVSVLMFRFNNPDALLVLLMVAAAYAVTRALEDGATKWLVWAGVFLGFGFLTKMLQVLTVMPGFFLAYLIAGPPRLGKRLWQLVLGGLAFVAAAGWWVAIVELWPTDSRPYIGGSENNSVLDLVFGYNGFGRLTGNETGSVIGGGGQGQAGSWGPTGWTRLFNDSWGGQASWLIPAALLFAIVGVALAGLHSRTDRLRAAVLVWGGWLFFTGATFSLGEGIIHEYYAIALAPAIGALVGIGTTVLWARRSDWWAGGLLAAATALSAWWAFVLLGRTPDWLPWLRPLVLIAAVLAVVGLLAGVMAGERLGQTFGSVALTIAAVAALAGPVAYSLGTVNTESGGAIPLAGPAGQSRSGPAGRGPIPRPGDGPAVQNGQNGLPIRPNQPMIPPNNQFPPNGQNGLPPRPNNQIPPSGQFPPNAQAGRPAAGGGGLLDGATPSDAVVEFLEDGSDAFTWALATAGANRAAGYQLATGDPVMVIGGFNGTDPWPTLDGFEQLVADGEVHYYLAGGAIGGGQGRGTSAEIDDWVTAGFASITVDGTIFYDLTQPLTD